MRLPFTLLPARADPFTSLPLLAICSSTVADTARAISEAAALRALPLRGAPR